MPNLGVGHSKNLFSAERESSIAEILNIAQLFPRFVEEDDNGYLMAKVTKGELLAIIHSFQKDKSPSMDEWPIEFYLGLFDLIGEDLLKVVEESWREGFIHAPLNSTFIALIPKFDHSCRLNDFKPISLCNCLYKIISKSIEKRLKGILSRHISKEQFGFLECRQIHEAIGVAQEGLHSVKKKKLKGTIFKIDLSKSYDRVNFIYICMLLTHLGFHISFIRWIISCLTLVSFVVLINGVASPFFHVERGLRQGCPLSPLLLFLVAEGLSIFMKKASSEGNFRGLPISQVLDVTHLLFVDDILIFYDGSFRDVNILCQVLELFKCGSGMIINDEKYFVTWENLDAHELTTLEE